MNQSMFSYPFLFYFLGEGHSIIIYTWFVIFRQRLSADLASSSLSEASGIRDCSILTPMADNLSKPPSTKRYTP